VAGVFSKYANLASKASGKAAHPWVVPASCKFHWPTSAKRAA